MLTKLRRSLPQLSLPFLACYAIACTTSPAIEHAKAGQRGELRHDLEKDPPSQTQARRIAGAVLAHEIETAEDRQDRTFIQTIRSCSAKMAPALEKRAEMPDGVGAEAAMVLLELGKLQAPQKYRESEDGARRALAARASRGDFEQRLGYYTDPDQRVRRAALRAASEAKDERDVEAMLEVARLDPDPVTQSLAIRSLGYQENPKVSSALAELYATSDEQLRLAIVQAWATPPLYEHGGRRELTRLATHEQGLEVVVAGSLLARDESPSVRNPAITRLLRVFREGTADEQRLALVMMPKSPRTSEMMLEKSKSEEADVAIIAWSRLLGDEKYRSLAEKHLITYATDQESPELALQAQAALSAAGSSQIVRELLVAQLKDDDPAVRRMSAQGLIRMGLLSEAVPLVADEDTDVRRAIACGIVGAPVLTREKK